MKKTLAFLLALAVVPSVSAKPELPLLADAPPRFVPEGWRMETKLEADFNADGKSDLLLENTNHDLSVWLMDGTTVTANPVIGHIASGWDFLGV